MKKLKLISCFILCLGFVFSLCQAANDYGIRTNKLSNFVLAQSDDTSGKGDATTPCDGSVILCSSYMQRETQIVTITSNKEGSISVFGQTIGGFKRNTAYSCFVENFNCRPHTDKRNVCDKRQERTVLTVLNSSSSNGSYTYYAY